MPAWLSRKGNVGSELAQVADWYLLSACLAEAEAVKRKDWQEN